MNEANQMFSLRPIQRHRISQRAFALMSGVRYRLMPDASVNEVPKDLLTWKTRVNCERGNTPTAAKKEMRK